MVVERIYDDELDALASHLAGPGLSGAKKEEAKHSYEYFRGMPQNLLRAIGSGAFRRSSRRSSCLIPLLLVIGTSLVGVLLGRREKRSVGLGISLLVLFACSNAIYAFLLSRAWHYLGAGGADRVRAGSTHDLPGSRPWRPSRT